MEHFHYKIPGWFTFPGLYSQMVDRAESGARFVEVGTWQGCSAAYMAVEIINAKKNIDFTVVDCWGWYSLAGLNTKDPDSLPDDLVYDLFLKNIEPVKHVVNVCKEFSVRAADGFYDESLDFVFIDANHEYPAVYEDLENWYLKVKPGGVIAGHDYFNDEGVSHAVNDFFAADRERILLGEGCWLYFKP